MKVFKALAQAYAVQFISIQYPRNASEDFLSWALCKSAGAKYWGCYIPTLVNKRFSEKKKRKHLELERNHEFLFAGGKSVAGTALLFSRRTRDRYRGHDDDYYVNEFAGWAEVMLRHNILFDVVFEEALNNLDPACYELLILPDFACMSGAEAGKIRDYVRNGGNVIISHETSLFDEKGNKRGNFALSDLLGLNYVGTLSLINPSVEIPADIAAQCAVSASEPWILPHKAPAVLTETIGLRGESLADIGISDMYGKTTAIWSNKYGRGKILYFSGKPGLLTATEVVKLLAKFQYRCHIENNRISEEYDKILAFYLKNFISGNKVELQNYNDKIFLNVFAAEKQELIIHLLNKSGLVLSGGKCIKENYKTSFPQLPEGNILLKIRGCYNRVNTYFSDTEGNGITINRTDDFTEVHIPAVKIKKYLILQLSRIPAE
ncbi:MAG: beta-galactosidase trimerization domain-containing protein [Victivallaceae bacterium]|nr:beta-galactosidase trimerization domain-containing protein [Victivallaceae bacterium]